MRISGKVTLLMVNRWDAHNECGKCELIEDTTIYMEFDFTAPVGVFRKRPN